MGVRIDAARHDVTAAGIDFFGTGRRFEIGADGGDRAVTEENVGAARIVVIDDGAAADELGHVGPSRETWCSTAEISIGTAPGLWSAWAAVNRLACRGRLKCNPRRGHIQGVH